MRSIAVDDFAQRAEPAIAQMGFEFGQNLSRVLRRELGCMQSLRFQEQAGKKRPRGSHVIRAVTRALIAFVATAIARGIRTECAHGERQR